MKDAVGRCSKIACIAIFGTYAIMGVTSNLWTPQQYKQYFEKIATEKVQVEKYNQKLFGENGYAQKDNNSKISFDERFDAYKRVGLEGKIIFKSLSAEYLERAVRSYEADNKK